MSTESPARMSPSPVRVLGLLVGNLNDQSSGAFVKYGQLFGELGARCALQAVVDVELYGLDRYKNALHSLRMDRARWREAFHKNSWAFARRSELARRAVHTYADTTDVVLQHGAIFHVAPQGAPPVVLYTDFTYRLAQREDRWRNPFDSVAASEAWNALEQRAYQGAALVLTRSEYARRSVIDDYGVPSQRVLTVGGGVNFHPMPVPTLATQAPRVLFIGKDFVRKGGDLLLAAFARVQRRLPDAELWLLTGSDFAAAPGVRRIPPTYDRAAIAALYGQAALFAMPARCETWGDVFLEAMACGLPCIGTTSDAMPEIIVHGETGLLVPPGDVEALENALFTLLGDPDRRRELGARGRQRVATSFTWPLVAERITEALRTLCCSNAP